MLAELVAGACPRALRVAWVPAAPDAWAQALRERAVQTLARPERGSCGAVVLAAEPDRALLMQARAALGPRGRVYLVIAGERLAAVLLELSRCGLEPKRLLVHSGEQRVSHDGGLMLVVAVPGRRGGLVVERRSLC